MNNKKKGIIVAVSAVGVLLAVYFGGAMYYSSRFLPGTTIDGTAYGNQTVTYVKEDYERLEVTEITLKARGDVNEVVTLEEIGYNIVVDEQELNRIKGSQNNFGWIGGFGEKNYELAVAVEFDEGKLNQLVDELEIISGANVESPQDAYIDLAEGGIQVIPEVQGNEIDGEKLRAEVLDALRNNRHEIDLEEAGCYLEPSITAEAPELVDTAEKLGQYNDLVITYTFADSQEVLDITVFADWLSIEENEVVIDKEKAREFVQGLSAKYDTYQKDRQFKTTNKGVITVGGGIYGWLLHVDQTTDRLLEMMDNMESGELEAAYWVTGREQGVDIGDTYIEINLNEQHMWFYKDGKLFIDTPIVTGLPTVERETPTGVFCVWSKERQRYLRGDDYELWIEYWMPIDWTGVGIHDSYWQSAYGSNVYLVYGSHGCINTPREIVAQIYENCELYTPVVVYKA